MYYVKRLFADAPLPPDPESFSSLSRRHMGAERPVPGGFFRFFVAAQGGGLERGPVRARWMKPRVCNCKLIASGASMCAGADIAEMT